MEGAKRQRARERGVKKRIVYSGAAALMCRGTVGGGGVPTPAVPWTRGGVRWPLRSKFRPPDALAIHRSRPKAVRVLMAGPDPSLRRGACPALRPPLPQALVAEPPQVLVVVQGVPVSTNSIKATAMLALLVVCLKGLYITALDRHTSHYVFCGGYLLKEEIPRHDEAWAADAWRARPSKSECAFLGTIPLHWAAVVCPSFSVGAATALAAASVPLLVLSTGCMAWGNTSLHVLKYISTSSQAVQAVLFSLALTVVGLPPQHPPPPPPLAPAGALWQRRAPHRRPVPCDPRAPFNNSAPLGVDPPPGPAHPSPPLLKDCAKFSSGPSADHNFFLAPSGPMSLYPRYSSAPLKPLGSANAEATPAGAPAAAADRTQRPDATCEGKNG